jgi:hypothetical protein
MQHGLSLPAPTVERSSPAIRFDLRNVPPNRPPPLDLALVGEGTPSM